MSTPNNINPNGVSNGNQRVVPTDSNINPNGGGNVAESMVKNEGTVHVTGTTVEPTSVEYRGDTNSLNMTATIPANNITAPNAIPPATSNNNVAQRVVVEDSVTHQAGEGITSGMSPSLETPDIFDNSPQVAIKTQTANQEIVDDSNVTVIPEGKAVIESNLPVNNTVATNLETLPDGSVDIRRD